MSAKRSPGPWRWKSEGYQGDMPALVDANGDEVCNFGDSDFFLPTEGTPPNEADQALIAASPELLESQTMGQSLNTPDFLDWIADRCVTVYGESPDIDFVRSLRERAAAGRSAIAKATGGQS